MARYEFRTVRLFMDADLREGAELPLSREQGNYVQNVLRLPVGAPVLVFNGCDGEWRAVLAGNRRAPVLAVESLQRPQTAAGDLGYAFAPLKHARLDYVVQKAVEMGASVLTPVLTQHTQVSRVNLDRMRANVIEAAEQCGILSVPAVEEPIALDRWLAALAADRLLIFCDEEADIADPVEALRRAPAGPPTLLVGPEGGFAEPERRALLGRGRVVRLSLGPRILRADTAAVAALALVQAVRGDWR
ncbi:MAG: 16S rRNA (uracil(1498)-N(3))-methyltransferase [Bradyrhizobiaceae bacterium]|nr:16S rRNA (uracil(1498)-N(3))-methyltransferase [Bradyrhizobiaceae bacterium]